MKVFLDTANLEEIKEAKELGILDGVTTNPSLMKKEVERLKKKGKNINLEKYIKDILKTCKGKPVSLEVTTNTYEEMVKEGEKLYKKFNPIAKNVYIKIPSNPSFKENSGKEFEGLKAIRALSKKSIPINCTLIFTPEQALMAAKAGAKFVSPFAGRIDDFLRDKEKRKYEKHDYFPAFGDTNKKGQLLEDNGIVSGVNLISEIKEIFEEHDIESEVLAASIRNPRQMRECALAGADIATCPYEVLKSSMEHKKTFEGMKKFTKDVVEEYAKFGTSKTPSKSKTKKSSKKTK
ncbi:MAG: transaldolase family protein [Candidatus Pacearchaeota archaeon]